MALPNPLEAFTWGAGGARKTPEQIAREREIADAMLAQAGDTSPVGHWTQGAARVANALGGVLKERRANKAEAANASESQGRIAALLGGMGGASQFPAAPGGAAQAAEPADYASQRVAQAHAPDDVRAGIIETASALGIDPIDLGTAISYETAGTFDPTKAGPKTQWGQHKGLIQFGEPQAQEHGVDWSNPVGSQLGANGAVASYLRKAGVQPGMGLLDIYSAINAGGVGRYDASDANNGGAPGTVADKVNQQMADHRQKAMQLLGSQQAVQQPVQVASLDPSAGMSAVPPEFADMGLSPETWAGMNAPDGQAAPQAAPALSAPQTVQDMPVAEPQQQVAQALMGGDTPIDQLPVTAGGTAGALQPGQMPPNAGMNPAILEALSSPYASDQERAIAGILLKQQMEQQQQANDPMRAMELERAQLELEQMRNSQPDYSYTTVDGKIVRTNKATGASEPVYDGGKVPDSVEALDLRAQRAGLQPGTPEYNDFMIKGGSQGTNINVDTGTIPQGYQAVRDEQGRLLRYEPIPGGPADSSGADASSAESRETSTGIITNAAKLARKALKADGLPATGTIGRMASVLPESNAAEVRRQVAVLQANARVENLQAMREASPTGGALGNVSDSEGAMLAAKSGALDPDSPTFERDLADYERTLLRIVHGPRVGDAIFEDTRDAGKPISEMTDEELEAISNGQ